MVLLAAPIGRRLADLLVVVLVLTLGQSSTTRNFIVARPITPKAIFAGIRDFSFQRKRYKNHNRIDNEIDSGYTGYTSSTRHQNIILGIARGGENTAENGGEQKDSGELVREVIGVAYQRLEDLEQKMQELVLDQSSKQMPLLEFGSLVQDILHTADTQLTEESGMNESFRRGLMKGIIVEVQRLYGDQLQALRNYYGQRYEAILDEDIEEDVDDDEIIDRRWAAGAEHMTQAFLAAAQNAVPTMFRTDPKDTKDGTKTKIQASFDHVDVLQGLLQDMIESTERRKDDRNVAAIVEANEEEEEATENSSKSAKMFHLPKLPKWVERLAARAFVFGVNYIQGWLAWQGIKRAAIERDRNQPKFPLF